MTEQINRVEDLPEISPPIQEEPAFLDDDGPSAEIPPFITTTNARELYDLRPGETVPEAIARRNAKGDACCGG